MQRVQRPTIAHAHPPYYSHHGDMPAGRQTDRQTDRRYAADEIAMMKRRYEYSGQEINEIWVAPTGSCWISRSAHRSVDG